MNTSLGKKYNSIITQASIHDLAELVTHSSGTRKLTNCTLRGHKKRSMFCALPGEVTLAKIVRMHNGKMNAIMLAIVEMEAAFATLASKDTNVKWNR
jgi:hypothetical protein